MELRRELGLFHVAMYGIGLILGAGIYVLIGEAANLAGSALWVSFVVGAVIATLTGLSYAELSSMYPKAASLYRLFGTTLDEKDARQMINSLISKGFVDVSETTGSRKLQVNKEGSRLLSALIEEYETGIGEAWIGGLAEPILSCGYRIFGANAWSRNLSVKLSNQ